MIPWLEADTPFPDVSTALSEDDGAPGLLAAGADLSPERLLDAYRHGIFPWYSEGQPVLWWSTDPRMVLHTDELHVSHSLAKKLRKTEREMGQPGALQVGFDRDFEAVMRSCAQLRPGSGGTWISEDIIAGYCGLHAAGFAHCVELRRDGELLAGAYGVCIGSMFYGESMFTRISDGSKIAFIYLVHFLRQHGVRMIDCQQETAHLASLGARPISRSQFLRHLRQAIEDPPIVEWRPLALFESNPKNFCP